jgi:hypothetical protein
MVCLAIYEQNLDGPPVAIFNGVQIDNTPTPFDCTVAVSAYQGDQRYYGHGVVVTHKGETFVVTSWMIFAEERDFITVGTGDTSQEVEVLYKDADHGLVALTIKADWSVELNDDPNIPPEVEVFVGTKAVNTAEYIDEYWIVLDGELPIDTAGVPVTNWSRLVGVVVGRCVGDDTQAIMCGNRGLREFCDAVVLEVQE